METLTWEELLDLNDEQLHDLGMQALGARRKILKAFETLKAEGYPPVIEKWFLFFLSFPHIFSLISYFFLPFLFFLIDYAGHSYTHCKEICTILK